MKMGNYLADARKNKGWTQKTLSRKLGVSAQYINDIEFGRRNPSLDYLINKYAKVLDLSPDYLHYLNGRFPEMERKRVKKLRPDEFKLCMERFRF